ncbi:MAG: DUF814 domain-containing protein [Candidatus Eremiobacteraeota bacterium]|nr:DUF814 domain-containing protein [Candidatus Eremiobacteraeota bacterium]
MARLLKTRKNKQRSGARRTTPAVFTDWFIVRRLAAELEGAVGSARIREAGVTSDDRFALRVRARGAGGDAVLIDAFGDMPAITLQHGIELSREHGWPRTIADAVEGMRIERVRARRGDRLISFDLATISRFGVLSSYRLVVELEPRFGNILLLKGNAIIAAARAFSPEQNPRRPVIVGESYTPPPLPQPAFSREQFIDALQPLLESPSSDAAASAAKALRRYRPVVPYLVAVSLFTAAMARSGSEASALAEHVLAEAESLVETAGANPDAPVHLYRNDDGIVQAHVVPLAQYRELTSDVQQSMLEVMASISTARQLQNAARETETRRDALLARVRRRLTTLAEERRRLERTLTEELPERLRIEGELLYAHESDVPRGASEFVPPSEPAITISLDPELDAKANAAAIFKRYRKTLGRRNHAQRRLEHLASEVAAAEELAWELERADAATLAELTDDADRIERRPGVPSDRRQKRRSAMEFPISSDARVLVGRSPRNNAELTFQIARPDDLWFHARGVPGAHVVLRIDSSRAPTSAELERAAELAAYHSKARTSGIVPVDYTARKHVRKQRNALPGLVWYSNAKTIDVTPNSTPGRPHA